MLETRITRMLGISYPIVMGGMMFAGTAELAAAVSDAGGLGVIAAGNYPSPGELKAAIGKLRNLTDRPFGVNVTLMPSFRPLDRGALVDTAVAEGAAAIELAGPDTVEFYGRIKAAGTARIIHKCAYARHARAAERKGADAVAIIGYEAGGAPPMDEVTTFIQVPQVADALGIPVLAGGGIGDARGFVAALALGAEGVIMGTRFLACKESPVHPSIKEAIRKAGSSDTMIVKALLGIGERVLKNEMSYKVRSLEEQGAGLDELKEYIIGERARKSWNEGDLEDGLLAMGQVIGLISEVNSVKEVIDAIVSGAAEIGSRLFPPAPK
ncbi:MAG: nitronate monooxygenase [Deltaproteobacteria bacterium]|nr:nitronate monooxygenase [Deltaproteobacteria bacterium]